MQRTTTASPTAAPLVAPAEPLVRMAPTMGLASCGDEGVCYGTEFISGTDANRVALYFDSIHIIPGMDLGGCGEFTLEQIEAFLPRMHAILDDPRVKAARRRAAAGLPPLPIEGRS